MNRYSLLFLTTFALYSEAENFENNFSHDEYSLIETFLKDLHEISSEISNIKNLSTFASLNGSKRDALENSIVFAAQFLIAHKKLQLEIFKTLFQEPKNPQNNNYDNNDDENPQPNQKIIQNIFQKIPESTKIIVLKAFEILIEKKQINYEEILYSISELESYKFADRINFLLDIDDLKYPDHLFISFKITKKIKFLKKLLEYLDDDENDPKFLDYKKIDLNSMTEEERENFKKYVFMMRTKQIIRENKQLFEDFFASHEELFETFSEKINQNLSNILLTHSCYD